MPVDNRRRGLSPSLQQHFQKMGGAFRDMGQGLAAAPPAPAAAPAPGAGLGDMLAGYLPGKLSQQAGVNDVGPGEGVLAPADPAFHAFSAAPPPMPQDPRMLAYQNQAVQQHMANRDQQHAQYAQQQAAPAAVAAAPPQPNYGYADPTTGVTAGQAQQAAQGGQQLWQNLGDLLYGAMSPPFRGGY